MNVVLIEDSMQIREHLCDQLLKLNNVSVVGHADNEDGALNLIQDLSPDLVLLDIALRVGNGMNVLRLLRNRIADQAGRVPLIMMLSNAQDHYRNVAAALGANAYFDKSFQIEQAMNQFSAGLTTPDINHNQVATGRLMR